MATQEVIKHTKKVYKIWNNKEYSFIYKLKEFIIEIVIIVFAVSLSIWMHNLTEHNEKKQIAKTFLKGLKQDLEYDIRNLKTISDAYERQKLAFHIYNEAIKYNRTLSLDTINKNNGWIFFSTTRFTPSDSRFEGIKSSGQLSYLENSILENDILYLYQSQIPWLSYITDGHITFKKEKLFQYYDTHLPVGQNLAIQVNTLLKQPILQRYLLRGALLDQIIDETKNTSQLCLKIITQINEELIEK